MINPQDYSSTHSALHTRGGGERERISLYVDESGWNVASLCALGVWDITSVPGCGAAVRLSGWNAGLIDYSMFLLSLEEKNNPLQLCPFLYDFATHFPVWCI